MWSVRRLDALPLVLVPNTIYFIDNGDGTATQYVTGRDGVARLAGGGGSEGPAGPQGDIGPVGATGATGPKGDTGDTGPAGPQGERGLAGLTGPQGPIGLAGMQGEAGPQGLTGATGPQGIQGATGATGPQGQKGDTGDMGPQGDVGPAGATGPTGATGAQGPVGPAGADGAVGATGPAGPGVPMGGTTGQVLAKASATDYATEWVTPSGSGSSDPLTLASTDATAPAENTVKLFRRPIAGRQFPAFVGPSGLDTALQPLLARNKVGLWVPPGNANTVPGVLGMAAMTSTGFTATVRNVATTNLFTRLRRLGYVTAATAGTVGQFRQPNGQYTLGDGTLGGFFMVVRFGISDAAPVAGARMGIGVSITGTPNNIEPSARTNWIAVGHGAADTNFKLYYGGSAAQTPIDFGANFPCNTANVDAYELTLFAPPSSSVVHYEFTRLNTGDVATGTLTGTPGTQLPALTTLLCAPWGFRTNNATALAVGLDVASAYVETDT